jgi:cytosine/uracil/thiamine/allantoin permease
MAKVDEHKVKCLLHVILINWNLVKESRSVNKCAKYISIKLTPIIRVMYGQKYRWHNHLTNRKHLRMNTN